MTATLWTKGGKLIIGSGDQPILCETCPCPGEGGISIFCCDSFSVCIPAATTIPVALFANVFVYDDVLMTTLLANFTIPISHRINVDYNGGFFRDGWYGCEARDPGTECFTNVTVFLQCASSEFQITVNGFACDGTVHFTGTGGTVNLVASPFAISNTGVSIASTSCGTVFVVVDISE